MNAALPNIDLWQHRSPLMDISRAATVGLTNLASAPVIKTMVDSLGGNYKPWYDTNLHNVTTPAPIMGASFDVVNQNVVSLINTIEPISSMSLQSGFIKGAEYSMFAEKSLSAILLSDIGHKISLVGGVRENLSQTVLDLSKSYTNVISSFQKDPVSYLNIDPAITRSIPIGYFSSANFIESITIDEEETEEEESLKERHHL